MHKKSTRFSTLDIMCFQNNNNKKYCLHSMRKVVIKLSFKRKALGEFVVSFVDIIFYIF